MRSMSKKRQSKKPKSKNPVGRPLGSKNKPKKNQSKPKKKQTKPKKPKQNYRTLPGEIWLPVTNIEGCEGFYISNKGRFRKNHELRKQSTDEDGYKRCNIGHNKLRVHRLVAEAFIPNPNNYPVVDHLDADKTNNCVENLEWVTQQVNSQRAVDMNLDSNDRTYIIGISPDRECYIFDTQTQAAEFTGISIKRVNKVACEKEKSCFGWRFIKIESVEDCRDG